MNHKIRLTEPLDAVERVELQQACQTLDEQRLELEDIANTSPADHELYGTAERLQSAWNVLNRILVADREMVGNSDNVLRFGQK